MAKDSIFSRGTDAAVQKQKEEGGGQWDRTEYFPKLDDGDSTVIRFITDYDETFNVLVHGSVKTKPKPADIDKDAKWPASMPAVCRNDKAFKDSGMFDSCYICDNKLEGGFNNKPSKPSVRAYGIAVARKAVLGTQEMVDEGKIQERMIGRPVGYTTEYRDVQRPVLDKDGNQVKDKDGKVEVEQIRRPAFILINKSVSNFWQPLKASFNSNGTICDRDYRVYASGEGINLSFSFSGTDSTPNFQPGTESWEELLKELEKAEDNFGVEGILMNQASDEYYERFFIPGKADKKVSEQKSKEDAMDKAIEEEMAKGGDDGDMMARMRARMEALKEN